MPTVYADTLDFRSILAQLYDVFRGFLMIANPDLSYGLATVYHSTVLLSMTLLLVPDSSARNGEKLMRDYKGDRLHA